jgi:hypothetical protein
MRGGPGRQDFVAEAGATRKPVGSWELFFRTEIEWGTRWRTRFGAVLGRLSVGRPYPSPAEPHSQTACFYFAPRPQTKPPVGTVVLLALLVDVAASQFPTSPRLPRRTTGGSFLIKLKLTRFAC